LQPPVHQGRRSARGGRSSGSGGGGGGHKVISITLQHDVKLHQTENAWKPDHASKKDTTTTTTTTTTSETGSELSVSKTIKKKKIHKILNNKQDLNCRLIVWSINMSGSL
jgi:hypothetical protein